MGEPNYVTKKRLPQPVFQNDACFVDTGWTDSPEFISAGNYAKTREVATNKVLIMIQEAEAGRYRNLNSESKRELLRRFEGLLIEANDESLGGLKFNLRGKFWEEVDKSNNPSVRYQTKWVNGSPAMPFHDLPEGSASYAQPDKVKQINGQQVFINQKACMFGPDTTVEQGRRAARDAREQAIENVFGKFKGKNSRGSLGHLPEDARIRIDFALAPNVAVQKEMVEILFSENSPITEVHFVDITYKRQTSVINPKTIPGFLSDQTPKSKSQKGRTRAIANDADRERAKESPSGVDSLRSKYRKVSLERLAREAKINLETGEALQGKYDAEARLLWDQYSEYSQETLIRLRGNGDLLADKFLKRLAVDNEKLAGEICSPGTKQKSQSIVAPVKGSTAAKGVSTNYASPTSGPASVAKVVSPASAEKPIETSRPVEMDRPPQSAQTPLQSAVEKGGANGKTEGVSGSAGIGRPSALHKRLYRDPQDIPNISSPKMRPGERVAHGAGGVLEIARIASEHAAIKHDFNLAMRYSAARTLFWWADKGVFPVATVVKDNWWGESDEYMGTLANSLPAMDQFDGLEVSALTEDVQYQAFEKWASSSLKNYDDYVRYFLQAQDAGVYRDNEEKVWKVRVWKWNDWLGNSDFSLEEDSRITKFMEPLYQQLLKNTQAEIAQVGKTAELKGVGRVVGIRRFLKNSWDKGAFDPSNPDVRLITGWGFEPTFFEVKTDRTIPPEYTLVTGGDLNTYARLRNTTVIDEINYPVISAGPISMFKPNFDAIALLKTESLTERSPSN